MITLYVRSYPKDFDWLHYSVLSMSKNLIGIQEKVLAVPTGSKIPTSISSFFDKIIYEEPEHPDGYIDQQVSKIRAYRHCSYPNILYSDSDCIYPKLVDASKYLIDNKVLLYKTKYSNIADPNIEAWKKCVLNIFGETPTYEYMRCFPIIHKAVTGAYIDSTISNYVRTLSSRSLSEFNCMGYIADTRLSCLYETREVNEAQENTAKQYWSWGGLTKEIVGEINGNLE